MTANLTIDTFVSEILSKFIMTNEHPAYNDDREHDFGKGAAQSWEVGDTAGSFATLEHQSSTAVSATLSTPRTGCLESNALARHPSWPTNERPISEVPPRSHSVAQGDVLLFLVMDGKLTTGDSDGHTIGYCPLDGPAVRCPFRAFVAMGKKHKKNATDVDKCFGAGMRSLSAGRAPRSALASRARHASTRRSRCAMAERRRWACTPCSHLLPCALPWRRAALRVFEVNGTTDGHHIGHALTIEHALMAELMRQRGENTDRAL